VVLLHGYGADGNDLIEIGRAWQPLLPSAAFVSPHAPEPCAEAPVGRQWFPLTFRDPPERWRGVNAAAPGLERFLDAELARHRLGDEALALVGFSQGTMMALHVGLRRRRAPAAIVGYSGLLVFPPEQGPDAVAAEISTRPPPPVLLLHGDQDAPHRRCSRPPRASRRSAFRRNGTSPMASATASTPRDCGTAASFSADGSGCGLEANRRFCGGMTGPGGAALHNPVMVPIDYGHAALQQGGGAET